MKEGYLSIVLHTHMPYVRKNGTWPVGEDWLYQVMSETYIPLLEMLERVHSQNITSCLTLDITPVLCEQLSDSFIKERFIEYLKTMIKHTKKDIQDFKYFGDFKRKEIAEIWLLEYEKKLEKFLSIDSEIIGSFGSLEKEGVIEIMGSCATHAFLPGLKDLKAVERQVKLGVEAHIKHFGSRPKGFWVPECAWRDELTEILEREEIEYVLLDYSAIYGKPTTIPYRIEKSSIILFARSKTAHENVWNPTNGYPTDSNYLDTTKYYLNSGNHYWKVTGKDVPIEKKLTYDHEKANAKTLEHALHFLDASYKEIDSAPNENDSPVVIASFDSELFGHGWYEGIRWLETVIRSCFESKRVNLTTPSDYLRTNPRVSPVFVQTPTSWGDGNDYSTWLNDKTYWMWNELEKVEKEFIALESRYGKNSKELTLRALSQAKREVLLLESSDWFYMVAKNRASNYAIERFRNHIERFRMIAETIENGKLDISGAMLEEFEDIDRLF